MTEPYVPQVGHRVRLSTTGVVSDVEHGFTALASGSGYVTARYEWERLPDPEPEWQPGDIVIDANDDVAVRSTNSRLPWLVGGELKPEDYLIRPLTRLVRETRA